MSRIDWTWRMNTECRWQNGWKQENKNKSVCRVGGGDFSVSTTTSVSLWMNQAQTLCARSQTADTLFGFQLFTCQLVMRLKRWAESAGSNPWKASSSKEGAMARRIIRWLQCGTAGAVELPWRVRRRLSIMLQRAGLCREMRLSGRSSPC